MMKVLWSRLKNVCDALGCWQAFRLSLSWTFTREYQMMVLDLTRLELTQYKHPEVRWSGLKPEDIPILATLNPIMSEENTRWRLDNGQVAVLGWIGDQLVHYRWDCPYSCYLHYLDLELTPLPGDLMVTGVYTSPKARGRGIYKASAIMTALRAKEQGMRRHLTFLAPWNKAPQHVWRSILLAHHVGSVQYRPMNLHKKHKLMGAICEDDSGRIYLLPSEGVA